MKDSAREIILGLRRGVNQKRSHCKDRALACKAIVALQFPTELLDFFVRKNSELMCSWKNSQGAIVLSGIVEMKTEGHDLVKRSRWSVGVSDAFFHRPRSPAGNLSSSPERQSGVLMPNNQPVCFRRFVE